LAVFGDAGAPVGEVALAIRRRAPGWARAAFCGGRTVAWPAAIIDVFRARH